uniref:Uncharacterized protein n=1 Tax=Rhizophora mucronata TaxID=61149 RepID=A0A2P2QWM3_RHIMU
MQGGIIEVHLFSQGKKHLFVILFPVSLFFHLYYGHLILFLLFFHSVIA